MVSVCDLFRRIINVINISLGLVAFCFHPFSMHSIISAIYVTQHFAFCWTFRWVFFSQYSHPSNGEFSFTFFILMPLYWKCANLCLNRYRNCISHTHTSTLLAKWKLHWNLLISLLCRVFRRSYSAINNIIVAVVAVVVYLKANWHSSVFNQRYLSWRHCIFDRKRESGVY